MEHKEFIRKSRGATEAVIFIHGILGTPNHFEDLVTLVPQEIDVYNILLDGHGGSVEDFTHSSMDKWRASALSVIDEAVHNYDAVYLVAHSMGTLFSIRAACVYPEKIKELFLIASPLKLFINPRIVRTSLLAAFGNEEKHSGDAEVMAARRACSVTHDKRVWKYLGWLPRYFELFREIRKTRPYLEGLVQKTRVYQSAKDEMVAKSAAKYFKAAKNSTVFFLPASRHFYYDEGDYAFLLSEFERTFKDRAKKQ